MTVLAQLARKIRLAIGLGIVKLVDDARQLQQVQVKLLNSEVRDRVNRYQDYGFTSVPLDGAECIVAAVGGSRSHIVILRCDDGRHRKSEMEAGEVAMYTDEQDFILMKRGREIEINAGVRVRVVAPEVIVEAATRVRLETPTCEMSGNLSVEGNVTSGGTVEGATVRTTGGIDLGSHVHPGVQSGGAATGAPQ